MNDFTHLKLADSLVDNLGRLGYRHPTALQEEAVPVIARGTTAVGIASAGSGKTLAYGLGLATRLDVGTAATQALVLRPTDDGATRTADALHRLLQPLGLTVGVVRPNSAFSAQVACASPAAALAALEHSAIKLDGLRTVVVDGASAMTRLGATAALETLAAQIPKGAQRVLFTSEITEEIEDWIDRHAHRARRLAYLPSEAEPLEGATLEFCAAPRHEWVPTLVRLFAERGPKSGTRTRLHCRLEGEARTLADQLSVRGVPIVESAEEPGVRIGWIGRNDDKPADLAVSWGTPPDLPGFRSLLERATRTLIFAEPRELAHLAQLAELLALRATLVRAAVPAEAHHSAQATRQQLREAATQRDLEPYMLLLEPLLEEFSPTQLAAAAAALLRERAPEAPEPSLPAWTRLYFGVGRRDGVRPADLVGAITGEASVTGDRIGRIEIRDTHSSVEVSTSVAERVIKALATATIRGRPAGVRVFRD
ncbi:MAG: DbpA RNA binding domain-containing protein [Gemmatimonadota bacterium]|nr:MAG: DbpA RNA binding domain-containing protein [Gemmatimonadota bacterium]